MLWVTPGLRHDRRSKMDGNSKIQNAFILQACRSYIHVIDAALQPPVTPAGAPLPFNQSALGVTNQTGAP